MSKLLHNIRAFYLRLFHFDEAGKLLIQKCKTGIGRGEYSKYMYR